MFRTGASRALPRSLRFTTPRNLTLQNALNASLRTSSKPSRPLALALHEPLKKSLVRYQSGAAYQQPTFVKGLNKKAEAAYLQEVLAPTPSEVSTASSIHPITSEARTDQGEPDVDMGAGIRSDFVRYMFANNLGVLHF